MIRTLIYNARLILPHEILYGYLLADSGKIIAVEPGIPGESLEAFEKIDAKGQYVSPGFIELHTHGAGGTDFMDCTPAAFITAAHTHMVHGTTTLLPTTLAASVSDTRACVETFLKARQMMTGGPHLPGLHMEGPYLNPAFKGAMNEASLRNPEPREYQSLMEDFPGAILRWTAAPELPGALEMGDYLAGHGVCVSMGHSAAEYQQVKKAVLHGYSHVTHLFSAMSSIVRRDGFRFPGIQESAFLLKDLTVEVIADGCHLPPELLKATWHFKGPDHTVLTCDSMRCAGTSAKTSFLGSGSSRIPVIIEDGVAKLSDRSGFGGSIATDDRLVRTMHHLAGVPLVDCIQMMCTTPARIIHMDRHKGTIACKKDADLVIFDENISIDRVLIDGKTTYKKEMEED